VTDLSSYEFSPLRGGEFTLLRGSCEDLSPILLVAAARDPPGEARLEHEYALRSELDVAWAARPMALTRHEERMALVLEDPGGVPLDRLLGRAWGFVEVLRIAIPLAGALRQAHDRALVHKDIKPANILVDVASGGVWLTGFGLATRTSREHQGPDAPEVIAGTLAYMAPEQTGRMNRSTDSRSDLYGLGIILYELLTGAPPFTASDPMELIHCHIARQPASPSERIAAIPAQLSAIVLKLLAKTPEARYQTAAGLEADLRRCLALYETLGHIDPFPPGAEDVPDRLVLPEKLYGREAEIETLLAAFDRAAAQGETGVVLVSGESGAGKSSLVNELRKAVVSRRGLFASGKFDQYMRDIPYATLAQAFHGLVRTLLGESEADLGRWREALGEALGSNGQLIVNLVPELELVIGKQRPVADLPAQDAQRRFQLVFRRFLGVFASNTPPLVLFVDDLQWLDAATLELLEHLATHPEVKGLLLIGAYRTGEVGASHPLRHSIDAIRDAPSSTCEISLACLSLDDVVQLVGDALHDETQRVAPLAGLLHEKTGGNPFFAVQFLTSLVEEDLLVFDSTALAWRWDIERIRAKSYSDNVVDLMAEKLGRLSDPAQDALKDLACLGATADAATLALVHEQSEAVLQTVLAEAVDAGLIVRQGGAYSFLHDRIQQAAYSLIPEGQRAEAHLRLGRALLDGLAEEVLNERVFDVASQFNRGSDELADRDEMSAVAKLNLQAGRKAKASAAYAVASTYLAAGAKHLGEEAWVHHYVLRFQLQLERAECEFLTAHFDQAEQLIAGSLKRAASKLDQAAAYHLKVQLHVRKSENAQAVADALACLQLFGIELPAHPTWEQAQAEYEMVCGNLDGPPIEHLIDLPLMSDPEIQAAMQVLSVSTAAAYFTDFNLWCLLAFRIVKLTMQHGMSGASAHGYALLGFILGQAFHRYGEGYRFAKLASDLVEKHSFIGYQAKVHYLKASVALWTQPIASVIDFMRAASHSAIETGNLTYACYGMHESVTGLLLRNDPLDEAWRESEKGLDFVRKAQFGDVVAVILSQQRFIATMQGRTATLSTFNDAHFNEQAFEAELTENRTATVICLYWVLKLKARLLSGDYVEALTAGEKARALLWAISIHVQLLDYFYYTALAVAAFYENGSSDEQATWRELLTTHRDQLREWAENYAPTFADKHALVSAEIARLEGRDAEAMRLYEEAIHSARDNGFVQNEGLAYELAARFFTVRGFDTIARTCLREARRCYLRWGAEGKVRQLGQLHPHLREAPIPLSAAITGGEAITRLDAETVVRASQALSSEIVLDDLIQKLMRITLEHAGAERGLLILARDGEPQIQAAAATGREGVEVVVGVRDVAASDLPLSMLHYVIRTREGVVLDDASIPNPYREDSYVQSNAVRSVLCLPIVSHASLMGALYLENSLTPYAFTSERVAVLEVLASQAAISLENARLFADVRQENADRLRAEEELRQAQADLAHASRVNTMGELTAALAHEVNQPITAAVTNANACLRFLSGETPDLEEAREAVTAIVQAGTRAAEIVSRTRDLFKKRIPKPERLEVDEVLRGTLVLLESEARRHGVSIRKGLAAASTAIMGDRIQLQQVIMNLIMNSIDAMKDVESARELVVRSRRTDEELIVVSISDTGVGLPAQNAGRIFDTFFTTKADGTGMGLAISRSIVEAHGGLLWAETNLPHGTIFHFTLPVSPLLVSPSIPESPISAVHAHVMSNIRKAHCVDSLATLAGMSTRNFARVFKRETNLTPADFVERARIDAARKRLEASDLPIKVIAYDCGFHSAEHMRLAFVRRLGIAPSEYRGQFRANADRKIITFNPIDARPAPPGRTGGAAAP